MSSAPAFSPERNVAQRIFAKNSTERSELEAAVADFRKALPYKLVGILSDSKATRIEHVNPSEHASVLLSFSPASEATIPEAVSDALEAKEAWAGLPFRHRAAVFLRCADLIAAKYRDKLTAALILCQGMDARQAEVDVSDLIDILRFNVQCAEKLYAQQPQIHAPGIWNTMEYPPLEGFVFTRTASDSLASAGNLVTAPVLMGNVVIWTLLKAATIQSHILLQIFEEAGLPRNVIQFLPGASQPALKAIISSPKLGAISFSGFFTGLLQLQSLVIAGMMSGSYHSFPRFIAETHGNNYHLIHPVCNLDKAVSNTVRAAFEYQGQKDNSLASVYVPASIWDSFKTKIKTATEDLSVGPTHLWKNFVGPVINEGQYSRLAMIMEAVKEDKDVQLLCGGTLDRSAGYFIHPTIYTTKNPSSHFLSPQSPHHGPILFICIYDDSSPSSWTSICARIKSTLPSSWKSGSIFASDRQDISIATSILRDITGNLCINTRCNAPQVAQSPYGGGRLGGTGEKVGTVGFLEKFVNPCAVKEELIGGYNVSYASHFE